VLIRQAESGQLGHSVLNRQAESERLEHSVLSRWAESERLEHSAPIQRNKAVLLGNSVLH
jgi:hypothetical protein